MSSTLELNSSATLELNSKTLDLDFAWLTDGIDPKNISNESIGLTDELLNQLFNDGNTSSFTPDDFKDVKTNPVSSCETEAHCSESQTCGNGCENVCDLESGETVDTIASSIDANLVNTHRGNTHPGRDPEDLQNEISNSEISNSEILKNEISKNKKTDLQKSQPPASQESHPLAAPKTRGQVVEEKISKLKDRLIDLIKQESALQDDLKSTRRWRKETVQQLGAAEWELGALGDDADLPAEDPSRSSASVGRGSAATRNQSTDPGTVSQSGGYSREATPAGPVDLGKSALLDVLGATDKQIEKFQMEDIRTVCDFERALNDQTIEKVRGIQERTMDKLKDKLIEWRMQHPVPDTSEPAPEPTPEPAPESIPETTPEPLSKSTAESTAAPTTESPATESPAAEVAPEISNEIPDEGNEAPDASAPTASPSSPTPTASAARNESPAEHRQRHIQTGYRAAMVCRRKSSNPWKPELAEYAYWDEGWEKFHTEHRAQCEARENESSSATNLAESSGLASPTEPAGPTESAEPTESSESAEHPESAEPADVNSTEQATRRRAARRSIRRS